MARVELEIPDDVTAVYGVAVFQCLDNDGEEMRSVVSDLNDPDLPQTIGLLTGALDDAREQFKERWHKHGEDG